MIRKNNIRPIALALIEKDDKFLVFKAYHPEKNEYFYRALGGGLDHSEHSRDAVAREFKEEIDAEIENQELLKVFENIFTYKGRNAHEIVFVYKADLKDKELYEKEEFQVLDNDYKAIWVSREELKKSKFYPEGVKELI